jgi:hypothetical protein
MMLLWFYSGVIGAQQRPAYNKGHVTVVLVVLMVMVMMMMVMVLMAVVVV